MPAHNVIKEILQASGRNSTFAAPTAGATAISATAPSAATSAINSGSATGAIGFSSLNNFRTTIRAISNLQVRMGEVENILSDIELQA